MGRNVGVAKEAALVAVRVLDCQGSGVVSDVMAGARSTLHSHSAVTQWHWGSVQENSVDGGGGCHCGFRPQRSCAAAQAQGLRWF